MSAASIALDAAAAKINGAAASCDAPVRSAAAWRRNAARLFDQQLWSFGYDIRRPEGNLLLELGCERIAAPPGIDCSSCYRVTLPTGERVALRGFGLLCEDAATPHAVFLFRDAFAVGWLVNGLSKPPWRIDDLPSPARVPEQAKERRATLVARAAAWIADYETAVTDLLGETYRATALAERDKPDVLDPTAAASAWRQIAREVQNQPELITGPTPRRPPKRRRRA